MGWMEVGKGVKTEAVAGGLGGFRARIGWGWKQNPRRRPGEVLQDPRTEAEETGERTLGLGQG